MRFFIGTSGYSYKEWKETFYPVDLPQKEMLRFYSEFFRTVEINNTFYRMPQATVLKKWAAAVPSHFRFAIKAPQRITHFKRFKDAKNDVAYLFKTIRVLGEHLGPVLFQTPPNFTKDSERLRTFLGSLPPESKAAFEFRHASWFAEDIFCSLRDHGAALCIAQSEKTPDPPQVATTDWGYLRLRRPDYVDADLARWVEWIKRQPWSEVFTFFKHEDEGKAPEFAQKLIHLTSQKGRKLASTRREPPQVGRGP